MLANRRNAGIFEKKETKLTKTVGNAEGVKDIWDSLTSGSFKSPGEPRESRLNPEARRPRVTQPKLC
jgi:hypothetical protein